MVLRWISIRIDTLGALFSSALAAYLVYGGGAADASDVGFSLSMAGQFTGMLRERWTHHICSVFLRIYTMVG
jgi:hypothetical protein